MTYIVKRKEELLRETDKLEKELFKKQVFILQDYYQKDRPREKVKGTFAALFQKWDREEAAASLGIHYLFSGILSRTYEYQLTLYGEGFYLDEKAVEVSWKPELFFQLLEEDVEVILNQLRERFPRLCPYEEELVRYHCARYYEAAICRLCRDILREIMKNEVFVVLNKTEDFFVFFSGYRGEGEVIAKAVCSKKPGGKSYSPNP